MDLLGAGWYVDHVVVKEGSYKDVQAIDEQKKNQDAKAGDKGKDKKDKGKDKGKKDTKKGKDKGKTTEIQDYRMWYFPCARWFDEGMDDKLIERKLTPGDVPLQEEDQKVEEPGQ